MGLEIAWTLSYEEGDEEFKAMRVQELQVPIVFEEFIMILYSFDCFFLAFYKK
jgi:hypothetical protein